MAISDFICTNPTKAARRYSQRVAAIMLFYVGTVFRVTSMVHEHHPTGWKLYLDAALPTIPILALLVVVGLYLREEVDEYKRLVIVRSMLVATGVTLALAAFTDFLRSYDAIKEVPPFSTFVVFWVVMGLAQAVQSVMNRVKDDD